MDNTKQPSLTKEQRVRYIKALLRGAKAEMDKKEKARSEDVGSERLGDNHLDLTDNIAPDLD